MRGLFSALGFLTTLPVPESLMSRRENGMLPWFPAAGLLIGALASLLWYLAGLLFPVPAAAVILIAGLLLLTGAIHVDGLADCADAFYGRRDPETVHRILKDPRIGTMGGLAIGIALLARYSALISLPAPAVLFGLPAAAVLSRAAALLAMRLLPYAGGKGRILRVPPAITPGVLGVAAVSLVIVLLFLPVPGLASLAVLALFWRIAWKKIGGSTGDVLGATIEIAEVVFLLALTSGQRGNLAFAGGFSYLRLGG
jgi:adenosylcobinamide-GDP ribazoletransferase